VARPVTFTSFLRAAGQKTARRKDRLDDVSTDAACCKPIASEMVGRVADRAVQIHGGDPYRAE